MDSQIATEKRTREESRITFMGLVYSINTLISEKEELKIAELKIIYENLKISFGKIKTQDRVIQDILAYDPLATEEERWEKER
ncbi:Hypothetical protein NTJ_08922 [Nesidiocoris tenuis]|uniref:Uncharacterized protein n=1 Tax=Nesidiocoris tenuis TaxID=355587 RepID=A0ABN7AVA8_9HEMI|nr:Hypothetical protein NTJ_08922 [Nesidiocoris tenuis]